MKQEIFFLQSGLENLLIINKVASQNINGR